MISNDMKVSLSKGKVKTFSRQMIIKYEYKNIYEPDLSQNLY